MLRIKDTKNMIGITIHGDYEDLNALHSALSDYLRFYFAHQDDVESSSCYENILGLCYDIRHAYQGDRNIEAVDNNYENIGQLASCIFSVDSQSLQKERNKYKSGNLYFNVEVLYPWAIFYLYTLQSIVEDHYHASWFDDEDFYNEYLAEKDLALITHFVQLLWDKLRNHLPEEVMKVVWTYTRTYNHIEYYFFYPDLYMEWLCTYWINGVKTRLERQELLSLLCLELSSILDEDPDEAWETIQKADLIKEKAPGRAKGIQSSGKTDFNTPESADKAAAFERNILTFQADIANTILTGLDQYDTYAKIFYNRPVPFQSMDEFLNITYDYIDTHGPFTEESYEKWLDTQLGEVDWDRLEW